MIASSLNQKLSRYLIELTITFVVAVLKKRKQYPYD